MTGSNTTTIIVQSMFVSSSLRHTVLRVSSITVPPPTLVISGSPRNMDFFQSLDLTLTCSITLDEAVNTSVMVQGMWNRNGTELIDGTDSGRITVDNPAMTTPPYGTTVRLNPLNNNTDAGLYECMAMVDPVDDTYITGNTATTERNVTIVGMV